MSTTEMNSRVEKAHNLYDIRDTGSLIDAYTVRLNGQRPSSGWNSFKKTQTLNGRSLRLALDRDMPPNRMTAFGWLACSQPRLFVLPAGDVPNVEAEFASNYEAL